MPKTTITPWQNNRQALFSQKNNPNTSPQLPTITPCYLMNLKKIIQFTATLPLRNRVFFCNNATQLCKTPTNSLLLAAIL
jgi:hypothetical protein